jgi:ribonuclease HIII
VFGPLVVAGVYVTPGQAELLARSGVRDSKTLSDAVISRLSGQIKVDCPQHVVLVVEPSQYNALYNRLKNLNHLLAQKHAEVITHLHSATAAPRAISDQFGDKRLIQDALSAQHC